MTYHTTNANSHKTTIQKSVMKCIMIICSGTTLATYKYSQCQCQQSHWQHRSYLKQESVITIYNDRFIFNFVKKKTLSLKVFDNEVD